MNALVKAFRNMWKFLQEVWREVHPRRGKVTWPPFKTIRVSTVVVMISSVILALYIAACDYVLRGLFVFAKSGG